MQKRLSKIKYKKNIVKILIASLIGILTLIFIYWVLGFVDKKDNSQIIENAGESVHAEKKTTSITFNNKTIELGPYTKNILLMGIDTFEQTPIEHSDSYYNYQQADFLALVVVNTEQKTLSILHINRDTMTDVPWLTINGKVGGINYEQIALSHTYGSGREDSCKNTVNAVSSLLFNIPIDYYVCISMSGLPIINDAVGGVHVLVEDDFSEVDSTLIKGENVLLLGEHSLNFVRSRKGVGEGTNLGRMNRQKEYINGFLDSYLKVCQNEGFLSNLFDLLHKYVITDFTTEGLINTMNLIAKYKINNVFSTDGIASLNADSNYIEFFINKNDLFVKMRKIFN